jgi:hypothetical protein
MIGKWSLVGSWNLPKISVPAGGGAILGKMKSRGMGVVSVFFAASLKGP